MSLHQNNSVVDLKSNVFYGFIRSLCRRLKADECTVQITETANENAFTDYREVPVEVSYKWGMMNGIELLLGAMNQGLYHTKLLTDSSQIEDMTGFSKQTIYKLEKWSNEN